MYRLDDVMRSFHAEEYLRRAKEYRDKARYQAKFYDLYKSQLRLYYDTKKRIHEPTIVQQLSKLEEVLLK